jgi:hypothetical protein
MSGHNIIQQLAETFGGYVPNDGDLKGQPLFVVNSATPSTGDEGWIWLYTGGTSADARMYLKADPSSNTWVAVDAT